MKLPIHLAWCALALLGACAATQDHFYSLSTVPDPGRTSPVPTTQVRLDVTVPSVDDRSEMVLTAPDDAVLILEHERWAAPLADEVAHTLARDLERQRDDLLVADRRFDRAGSPPVLLKVDIVRMSAVRGGRASIEAHWRLIDADAGVDRLGGDTFDTPAGADYPGIARAYSVLLGQLAEKLAAGVRRQ